jgi:uncharacterized damage-inducible protein DinB
MSNLRWTAAAVLMCVVAMSTAWAQSMPKPDEKRTIQQVLDRSVTNVEKEFVSAAEAMPDDKYDFVPTSGEFKGVRNFAAQVKHVAASNFDFAAVILQEKPPVETGEEGPASVKSKAECVKYLKDSFAYVHKAMQVINEQNAVESLKSPWGQSTVTRLGIATLTVAHCFDHYGQMVVYLRMNGIVPPASRQ